MISFKELLFTPEKFNLGFGSHKSVQNVESREPYADVNMENIFKSQSNSVMLARNFYTMMRNEGVNITYATVARITPELMRRFCLTTDVNQYKMAEVEASVDDWDEVLRCVNDAYLSKCRELYAHNRFNPFRVHTTVGDIDNRVQKKFQDMTAEDHTTFDAYANQYVQVQNKNKWMNNKVWPWQAAIQKRNYDREPGGYRYTSDRSSLDVPMYNGYDMRTVNSVLDAWRSDEWFSL